jgi:hypothetical protein
MLNLLLKPLLGVAGQAVSGFVETKKAKAQLKLTEVQAATKLKQDQIAGRSFMGGISSRPNERVVER